MGIFSKTMPLLLFLSSSTKYVVLLIQSILYNFFSAKLYMLKKILELTLSSYMKWIKSSVIALCQTQDFKDLTLTYRTRLEKVSEDGWLLSKRDEP